MTHKSPQKFIVVVVVLQTVVLFKNSFFFSSSAMCRLPHYDVIVSNSTDWPLLLGTRLPTHFIG